MAVRGQEVLFPAPESDALSEADELSPALKPVWRRPSYSDDRSVKSWHVPCAEFGYRKGILKRRLKSQSNATSGIGEPVATLDAVNNALRRQDREGETDWAGRY